MDTTVGSFTGYGKCSYSASGYDGLHSYLVSFHIHSPFKNDVLIKRTCISSNIY